MPGSVIAVTRETAVDTTAPFFLVTTLWRADQAGVCFCIITRRKPVLGNGRFPSRVAGSVEVHIEVISCTSSLHTRQALHQ